MKRIVILIAEDEPFLRLLVASTLDSPDYEIAEAADGDAAWDLLRSHRPALAILDVQMPGRTGLDLTRAIRADPSLSHTIVVMLSAKAQAVDIAAGMDAGADHYLTKPFSPQELLELVEQSLLPAS